MPPMMASFCMFTTGLVAGGWYEDAKNGILQHRSGVSEAGAETKTFGMESHKTMGVRVSFCDFILLKWLHRPFWSCFGILLYLVESFL